MITAQSLWTGLYVFLGLVLGYVARSNAKRIATWLRRSFARRRKKLNIDTTNAEKLNTIATKLNGCSTFEKLLLLQSILGSSYTAKINVKHGTIEVVEVSVADFSIDDSDQQDISY